MFYRKVWADRRQFLQGFVVDLANDGHTGLEHAISGGCDLVILDVSLPGIDGWSVLEATTGQEVTLDSVGVRVAVDQIYQAGLEDTPAP